MLQEFAGGSLSWRGSQSVQRYKTGLTSFIKQLRNAFTLFLIESRDKTLPKALLRPVPNAADKAFKDADARQQHLVDDQPGHSALDQRPGLVIATPAQRIKPSGQAKPGRSIVGKFRKAITLTDQYKMAFALTPEVKITFEGRIFLQTKLVDQETRYRDGDFEIDAGKDADELGRSQHECKAEAIMVASQPIDDLPIASVQMEILRQLVRRRSGGKICIALPLLIG